jgi:hypothetical protein
MGETAAWSRARRPPLVVGRMIAPQRVGCSGGWSDRGPENRRSNVGDFPAAPGAVSADATAIGHVHGAARCGTIRRVTPSFDSPVKVLLNVVSIAVFLTALVVVHRQRNTHGYGWDAAAAIFFHLSVNGWYLPLGPIVFLIARGTWHKRPAAARP